HDVDDTPDEGSPQGQALVFERGLKGLTHPCREGTPLLKREGWLRHYLLARCRRPPARDRHRLRIDFNWASSFDAKIRVPSLRATTMIKALWLTAILLMQAPAPGPTQVFKVSGTIVREDKRAPDSVPNADRILLRGAGAPKVLDI